jgi:hypothetical protein
MIGSHKNYNFILITFDVCHCVSKYSTRKAVGNCTVNHDGFASMDYIWSKFTQRLMKYAKSQRTSLEKDSGVKLRANNEHCDTLDYDTENHNLNLWPYSKLE